MPCTDVKGFMRIQAACVLQIATLMDHSSKNVPNLRNLLMEMRKLCCHPYLCNGLEVGTCAHLQH